MNSINELSKMSALIRGIKGEDNIVENMEKEGQQHVISNTMMARKMWPSKEHFEQLGFIFEDIPGDDVLCYATLPDGWSMKETDNAMCTNIIDENRVIRGSLIYKAAVYDRRAHMYLKCHYMVCSRYADEDHLIDEIYFGNEKEILFVAGQTPIDAYDDIEKLKALAKQYAYENYPDWENVHAYWDKDKENSNESPKQIVKK